MKPYTYVLVWVILMFTLPVFSSESTVQLTNLSYRGKVGTGDKVIIAGFVIQETPRQSESGVKKVLIRAVGPSLATLRPIVIPNPLPDPELYLYSGNEVIAYNDNWVGTAENQKLIRDGGAFELESNSKDSVIIADLPPGAYTALMGVKSGAFGTGLVEVYDLTPHVGGEFINFSVRGRVNGSSVDESILMGYSLIGDGRVTILTRAVGPGLALFGVEKYLEAPLLTVFIGDGTPLGGNGYWSYDVLPVANALGVFPLPMMSRNPGFVVDLMFENGKSVIYKNSSFISKVHENTFSYRDFENQDLNDLVLVEVYKVP